MEIRKVPANWKHPKKADGSFRPLIDNYVGYLEYFRESADNFIKYMTEVIEKGKVKIYDTTFKTPQEVYDYLTEEGQMEPPDISSYMPSGSWFQLFETVSEGTPLTPPFETKQELVEWLSNNKDYRDKTWTREQAEAMVEQEWVMSGMKIGEKFYDSQESLLVNKK